MEELKRENGALRYNLMKFDVICLNSMLKLHLNLGSMT
jgi:hypothetical protein